MTRPITTANMFALLVGILLLVQGIWDLIDPPFLGVFTSNLLHAVIHVVLGVVAILTAVKGGAYTFLVFLGIILLSLGILFFIEPIGEFMIELFLINEAVAWLNIGVGGLSLLAVLLNGRPASKVSPRRY